MKKRYFLLLFFTSIIQAQIINIPDANLKARLLSESTSPLNIIAASEAAYIQGSAAIYTVIDNIDSNHDGEIEVSEALLVQYLNLYNSNIASLEGIQYFSNLKFLSCGINPIESVELSGLPLEILVLRDSQLSEIDVSGFANLKNLNVENNHIGSIDVSQNAQLEYLTVTNNQLTKLDVGNNGHLKTLRCSDNFIETLLMKNGRIETSSSVYVPNPNLTYVCADEGQIATIQNQVGPNVEVNSYCLFNPGGNYFTILGTVKFDANSNGCDAADLPQSNIRINFIDANTTAQTFSDAAGNYSLYTASALFHISAVIANPGWFTVTPGTVDILAYDYDIPYLQNFCIAPNGFHPDVEVVISPLIAARPGLDAEYLITYTNKGNTAYNEGLLNFQYDDAVLDYAAASQNLFSQSSGTLSWQYTHLLPFESRSIRVRLNVNTAVSMGDHLVFTASSFPSEADETPLDNTFAYDETVTDVVNPNNKTCLEGDAIAPDAIGNYLHYSINFENTGTTTPLKVAVRDMIDSTKFDISTLEVLYISHPAVTRVSPNRVEFLFDDIHFTPGSHGNIVFRIKTRSDLVVGDTVLNKAQIYFDYGFPAETNTAAATFQSLSTAAFEADHSVVIYPNPAWNQIAIRADHVIQSIQLFDVEGRIINTTLIHDMQSKLDIGAYAKGIYLLKVSTEKGVKIQKIIKE